MEFSRYLLTNLFGVAGGVLANLLAAMAQSSFGRFTPFQAVSMTAGIVVFIVLSYRFQPRENPGQNIDRLHRNLAEQRNELHRLLEKAQSREIWRLQDVQEWENHARWIAAVKAQLDNKNEAYPYDRIDTLPPPDVSYLIKTAGLVKQVSVMLVVPFLIAFGISFYASPFTQTAYLAIRPPVMPLPTAVVAVVSPSPVVTAILASTGTVVAQRIETPQPLPAATPTDLRSSPTPVIVAVAPTFTVTRFPSSTIIPPLVTLLPPTLSFPLTPTSPVGSNVTPPELLSPQDGQVFSSQDAVELRWSNVARPEDIRYLLVIEHGGGASFVVTNNTSWNAPEWLRDFQPAEGVKWWVTFCGSEIAIGEYSSNPCGPTRPPSTIRRFGWGQTFDSPAPSPTECTDCAAENDPRLGAR